MISTTLIQHQLTIRWMVITILKYWCLVYQIYEYACIVVGFPPARWLSAVNIRHHKGQY